MTQDRQNSAEQEALIAEMLRSAQKAEVVSDLEKNPVIHRGDGDLPAPAVVSNLADAGRVWIWDTRTYRKAPCLSYMVPSKLRQRRPDGSYIWTTNDPGKLPQRGTIKCMLHKDGPNRREYDALGFRVCNKDNITNEYQLRRHMQLKHPQEWAAVEEAKKEQERLEDRELQKLILARIAGEPIQKEEPVVVKNTPIAVESTVEKEKFICKNCGKEFAYKKNWRTHEKNCK